MQRDMNPTRNIAYEHSGMAQTNEELIAEVQRLRGEIQQLREIVNALFNVVFEDTGEEWEGLPHRHDEFERYN